MNEVAQTLEVRIELLPPMRMARFHARGPNPETQASKRLLAWAEPRGLLRDAAAHPVFGFNNPAPSRPGEEYGYEFWIRLDPTMPVGNEVETVDFPGGSYAVTTHHGVPNPEVWMRLLEWVRNSPYRHRPNHELERPHNLLAAEPEMVFELCLPIEPSATSGGEKLNVRAVDFILYPVSDLARAARFYRETLGLPQELYSEEWQWAEFNCGNVTLSLKGGEKLPETIPGGRIALAVRDVPTACEELKRKGVRVVGEPVDFTVCCAVEVLDPDGNTLILHRRADGTCGQNVEPEDKRSARILAMERAALERWSQGDPSGFLEICAPEVVYFDNTLERRLDGLQALTSLYESLRGRIHLDRYELLNPRVQHCGDTAVLTYNFAGYVQGKVSFWNCTQVYRKFPAGWRIVQTHWSPARSGQQPCEGSIGRR